MDNDRKFLIVIKSLLNGHIINDDRPPCLSEVAMDKDHNVGYVTERNGEKVVFADRFTVGQLYDLARSLTDEEITLLAANNALTHYESLGRTL